MIIVCENIVTLKIQLTNLPLVVALKRVRFCHLEKDELPVNVEKRFRLSLFF